MTLDKNQIKYRKEHKRCRFCKYHKHQVFPHGVDVVYEECICRDSIIRSDLQAIFCRYYYIEEGDIELKNEI